MYQNNNAGHCGKLYLSRLNPQSLKEHSCEVQVVPMESSGKTDFADGVVPDGKLKFTETSYFTSGTNLESFLYLSSEPMQQMSPKNQQISTLCFCNSQSDDETTYLTRPNHFSLPSLSRFSLDTPTNLLEHGVPLPPSSIQTKVVNSTQLTRRRRNSSGSDSRLRRHSTAAIRSTSFSSNLRQRRRSHDVRDEQADILDRLRIAATISTISLSPHTQC